MATTVTLVNYGPEVGDANLGTGQTSDLTVSDATQNASSTVQTLTHTYNAGAGADNIGVEVLYKAETETAGTNESLVAVRAVATDATAATIDASYRIGLAVNSSIPAEGSEHLILSPTSTTLNTTTLNVNDPSSTPSISLKSNGTTKFQISSNSNITTFQNLDSNVIMNFSPVNGLNGFSVIYDSAIKIGFYPGTTAVAQPSSTTEVTGFTAGAGAAVLVDSTFTGNSGTKAYTIGDVVKHLKALGFLATS